MSNLSIRKLSSSLYDAKKFGSGLQVSRRHFGAIIGAGLLNSLAGCQGRKARSETSISDRSTEDKLRELFEKEPLPGGMSAAAVRGESLIWSGGFGFADIEAKLPMTSDHIQNIASISKTITATAIMQLWEKGAFKLNDDINGFLPIRVRNPKFSDTPITFRQLLAHRSSIKDASAYDESYACGDPAVTLSDWIQGYFSPEGAYFDADENFHKWEPGTVTPPEDPRAYSNVAYGLLGFLVETITEASFSDYCQEHIFAPLKMTNTAWHLSDINQNQLTKVYSDVPDPDDDWELPAKGFDKTKNIGGVYPVCPYSFYNYPDGLLRTNVKELSRFLRAYINSGSLDGRRILEKETIDLILSDQHFGRALCWDDYGDVWGHDGGDPGVATFMGYSPEEKIGVVVFFNAGQFSEYTNEIVSELYAAARQGQ